MVPEMASSKYGVSMTLPLKFMLITLTTKKSYLLG